MQTQPKKNRHSTHEGLRCASALLVNRCVSS